MVVITIKKNNTYTVDDVYQWDTNKRLDIYGLNLIALPEIPFVNSKMSQAIVKQTSWNENGGITVEIPNVLFESPIPITIYICGYEGEEFTTMYSLTLKVKARVKPADYFAEDDEKIYSYNALENLVNNTIVNLTQANEDLHTQITAENEALHAQIIDDVNNANDSTISIVNNLCSQLVEEVNDLKDQTIEEVNNLKDQTIADVGENVTQAITYIKGLKSHSTTFNADGSITTTYEDGTSETTIFNADGSITQRIVLENQQLLISNTVFNADGSITTTISEEGK